MCVKLHECDDLWMCPFVSEARLRKPVTNCVAEKDPPCFLARCVMKTLLVRKLNGSLKSEEDRDSVTLTVSEAVNGKFYFWKTFLLWRVKVGSV